MSTAEREKRITEVCGNTFEKSFGVGDTNGGCQRKTQVKGVFEMTAFSSKGLSFLCALFVVVIVIGCFAFPRRSFGQTELAGVSGRITDASGGVIVDAEVEIKNVETGLLTTVKTNQDGLYTIPSLHPGHYLINVRKTGFRSVTVTELTLNVQDNVVRNFALQIGSVSETVTITADQLNINTTDGTVSTVVDRQFVENIPLNGRSFQSLLTLTPGVVTVPTNSTTLSSGQFSVNGQRSDANAFVVDGVSGNFGAAPNGGTGPETSGNLPGLTTFGTTQSLVSVDAMQEFRVQTSTYAAEYGRQPGGQISIVTRSGTNDYHGSVFDYLRNDKLDANDWFANANRQPKPAERQNDFGGTFGGPVRFPGYDGHNRTFFFFSYEGLRLRQPKFALMNVPTLCLRGQGSCPAGQNPAAAAVQSVLNAFPLPNGRDLGNGLAEQAASYSDRSSLNATSVRIDHVINQKWNLFGRLNIAPSHTIARSPGALSRSNIQSIKTETITVGLTSTITSRLINELRVNFTNNPGSQALTQDNFGGAVAPPISTFIPSQFDSPGAQGVVNLSFAGRTQTSVPALGPLDGTQLFNQRQLNLVDGFSWRAGPHQLKFGLDYRRLTPLSVFNPYGLIVVFTSQAQLQAATPTAPIAVVIQVAEIRPNYTNFSAYAQDTWKLSNRVTLDLGVRWDTNPAPGGPAGKLPLAVTEINNLATMQLAPEGTKLWKTTYNNFGPRIGLAYLFRDKPSRETVVRGGFGVFYDTGNNLATASFATFPFQLSRTVTAVTYPLSATQLAPTPLPNPSNLTPPFGAMNLFDPGLKLPYTLHWNTSLEQSLGKSQAVTVSYVGSVGRRLLQRRQLILGAINPAFTTVLLSTNKATSDYHALQAQFQRRLSRGLQALVSYTWSHALDEDSSDVGVIIPVRGNSSFDVRHNFAADATYDIPSPKQSRLLKAVLGMWSLDTSIRARSAFPVDITGTQFFDPATGSLVAPRANVIPGVALYINDPTVPGGRKINRAAFSVPAAGQFGNLGRNVARGLGAWQVDAALRRQLKLTERLNLQFRAEAFNVFNHPNFGAIQTTLGTNAAPTPNFGQATNMLNNQLGGLSPLYQIGGPRSFQFALKLLF